MRDVIHKEFTSLTTDQAIDTASRNVITFGRIWFPRTFRQENAPFHYDMSDLVLTPGNRMVAFKIFRDGAKTSFCRTLMAFKVAYALGNTGMIVGDNSTNAERSLRWLKKQIEFNRRFTEAYGLKKGKKWSENWIEIINTRFKDVYGEPLVYAFVATGITGSTRGLNIDDYRPDFILCDDICNNENVATAEQRKKVDDTLFGDLLRSLAPESENILAQLVFVQTPIDREDAITKAESDPRFKTMTISCFTETGESSWPARRNTLSLQTEKLAYIQKRQLYLWMREMEVQIIQAEKLSFDLDWFQDFGTVPDGVEYVLSIDPAPVDITKVADEKQDWQVLTVVGFFQEDCWVECQHAAKNEDPDSLLNKVFEWSRYYKTLTVIVEAVAYQKVLMWYMDKEMTKRRVYLMIEKYIDKRSKYDRITQAILAYGPYGHLYVRKTCTGLLTEAGGYGLGYKGHDDHLDSLAIALSWKRRMLLPDSAIEGEYRKLYDDDGEERDEQPAGYLSCP